ncbi:FAD-dependent oxidoreductase [Cloacibacillus sp. An23]|uniref:NAD(P)/FAD-dependent oxidoreductase n=1 Tax=Cloacibacillus sp. An23 TaxID=1965591 RepID=UPI000B3970C0|nr:FAD-dependent oxidoreductase [Cloacibacillus sp. An23]OUO93235.1 pyridine nucleotide-disulfide oxidoreductase [Cloacibacillus sp. An23]
MIREKHDLVIIGGGPAGLAAAVAAKEAGCSDIVLVERDRILGGILNQCIHDGFGLHAFKEALSGPEYADRFIKKVRELQIPVMEKTIVLDLSKDKVLRVSREGEIKEIEAKAVVLAMGCRERTRGALSIPGHRPAGVYTAGTVQNLVNLENIMPGKHVVILGSGDIGLIMARRMTLEGAKVEAVFEVLPYSSGLQRNIRQCLDDYGIPLYLSMTVVDIYGPKGRVEGVTVAKVDEKRRPIAGTERFVPCDTLLLSVGLIPENELTREAEVAIDNITQGADVDDSCMTKIPGVFACGNVLHVHDLVDFVSMEAERAGRNAARYVAGELSEDGAEIAVRPGEGVRYVVPQRIKHGDNVSLAFRVTAPSRDKVIEVRDGDRVLKTRKETRLHPAEMVWVDMGKMDISGISSLEVRVR